MYKLSGVTKNYQKGRATVAALRGVDLVVEDGEWLAIQGPTGHGKSTLLQILGGLDRPSAGIVDFDGRDLAQLREAEVTRVRAQSMGFIFQTFNLIPTLSAQENVEAALVPLHVSAAARRQRAAIALDTVGLADRLRHVPGELSGGQQQRVAIARALVKEPKVLLADEPTGNLDEDTRDEIIGLLETMWRERGLTMVLVTHDSTVARRAQRIGVMKNGRLTFKQPARSKAGRAQPAVSAPLDSEPLDSEPLTPLPLVSSPPPQVVDMRAREAGRRASTSAISAGMMVGSGLSRASPAGMEGGAMSSAATRTPADVARAVFDAVSRKDPDGIIATGVPGYVDDFVAIGEIRGHEAVRAFFRELFAAFPDFTMTVDRVVADDASAVVQWHAAGTFTGGPFQGIAPTGRRVDIRGVDVMEIADGLIQHNTIYYDGATFARQIGLLPGLGSRADQALLAAFNAKTTLSQRARDRRRRRPSRAR